MNQQFYININGIGDLHDFVSKWSPLYSYSNEEKYKKNIYKGLDNKESFIQLFQWKNGTGSVIYERKFKVVLGFWEKIEVLRELKQEFNWDLFEKEFEPQKSSTIWKIFLLHLIEPDKFPIFDQHVYRSYLFFQNGKIEEIPSNSKKKYQLYKLEYFDWFNQLKKENNIYPKKIDESFFSFGKMLKGLRKFPIEINNN